MADEPQTVSVKVLREHHLFADVDKDGKATVPERDAATLAALGLIEYTPNTTRRGTKDA